MNRKQRLEAYRPLLEALIKKPNPMFGVYWAQSILTGVAYKSPDGYSYRLSMKILNEMVDDGLLFQYTTTQNENVYTLAIRK